MQNYIFGYARVSTEAQVLDRQIDMLNKYGVDHIYREKMTGTKGTDLSLKKCSTGLQRVILLLLNHCRGSAEVQRT